MAPVPDIPNGPDSELMRLLNELCRGNGAAASEILPCIYKELRGLARGYMQREQRGHSLQATTLVHEACLRLLSRADTPWENRAHFLAVAARAMRQILVDHARRRKYPKPGSEEAVLRSTAKDPDATNNQIDILALDDALDRLERLNPQHSHIVELRYFAGMSFEEIAGLLGVSTKTVQRNWLAAKIWLYRQIAGGGMDDAGVVAPR